MNTNHLNSPLKLPCGTILKNRLVKSAMTERISDKNLSPNQKHHRLYKLWANTGAGLLITGNVIVDPIHLESAGNVYVGSEKVIPSMKAWAEAAKMNDTQAWVQISHAGRQTNKFLTLRPLAPSEVQLQKLGLFGKPRAMTEQEILQLIDKFVNAALICKKAGFTGVQFHAAHGYLLSQFLSPKTNQRKDQWGGSIENRSRLLLMIIDKARAVLGNNFPISVKLNSSDFQKGGFTQDESLKVIKMLEGKIDLLEISGGTYEKVAFFDLVDHEEPVKESTKKREAYFIEFTRKVRSNCTIPILLTGGFRSFEFCNQVLANNELDLIGMARPFITNLEDIPAFLDHQIDRLEDLVQRTGIKALDDAAEGGFYARQLVRLANGQDVNLKMSAFNGALFFVFHEMTKAFVLRLFGRKGIT